MCIIFPEKKRENGGVGFKLIKGEDCCKENFLIKKYI